MTPCPHPRIEGGMAEEFTSEKAEASAWFRQLRDEIVDAFEELEQSHDEGPLSDAEPGRFEVTPTKRESSDGSDAGGAAGAAN